jgi:hypothetical protein
MSTVREFLLGRDEFKTADEIIEIVRNSPYFDPQREDTAHAEALLIFQTSKQQTWLVATQARLYCVLDDLCKSFTRVQWSIPIEKLVANGEVTIPITTSDKTWKTGRLNIGERRNWLFSKKLFTSEPIESRVRNLIARQMLQEEELAGEEPQAT